MRARPLALFLLVLALGFGSGSASAAPPVLPATMSYQGVLLDSNGDPQTGNVDLTLRIYDALSGGTLLYKQVFTGVALTDGVFSVQLGPVGSATDSPTNPLTTSFEDALAGDLAATGQSRFLGVTVGASGALPRTQIVSVPYALRSSRAASADQADVASDTDAVGGVPSAALTQIWENVSFDGGGPPNDDPSEGLQDTDGDGLANFVDSDNDGDAIGDSVDPGINLVTPVVSDVQPAPVLWSAGPVLQATGTSFEPGMTATFGGDPVTPLNVTATSFQVDLGPEPKGTHALEVTRLNGQIGSRSVSVTADSAHGAVVNPSTRLTLDATLAQKVVVGGGTGRFDSDGDGDTDTAVAGGVLNAAGYVGSSQLAVLRDASNLTGIVFFIDANANNVFLANEGVVIEPIGTVSAGTIAFGPLTERVAAYLRTSAGTTTAVVGHDRDNNGDFAGPNEVVPIETLTLPAAPVADMAIDASGHVAFAWYDVAAGGRVRLAWDRSGDGDFNDTVGGNPELSTLLGVGSICLGLAFDPNGVLSIVHGAFGSPPTLLRDFDGDGDFGDAGESLALGTGTAGGCDAAAGSATGLSVVHTEGGNVFLLVDRNGDDDFGDGAEVRHLQLAGSGAVDPVAVTVSDTGRSIVATRSELFLDVAP